MLAVFESLLDWYKFGSWFLGRSLTPLDKKPWAFPLRWCIAPQVPTLVILYVWYLHVPLHIAAHERVWVTDTKWQEQGLEVRCVIVVVDMKTTANTSTHTLNCLSPHRLLCCQSAIISWLLSSTNPPRVYHWYAPAPPGSRGGIIVCTQTGCVNATSSDHPCWHRSGHMLVSNNQNMGMFEIVTLTRRCRLVKFLIMHSPRRILVVQSLPFICFDVNLLIFSAVY